MDDDEIAAHLAGLRIAMAFAIKATCRNPAEVQTRVAALQDIVGLIPASLHPGVKDELDAVITAMGRLPVRDPSVQQSGPAAPAPQLGERYMPDAEQRMPDPPLGELL